jgi:hypothetical protein
MASNIFFDVDLSWAGVGQLLQIVCNVCPGFLGNLIAVTCYVSQLLLAGPRGHVMRGKSSGYPHDSSGKSKKIAQAAFVDRCNS